MPVHAPIRARRVGRVMRWERTWHTTWRRTRCCRWEARRVARRSRARGGAGPGRRKARRPCARFRTRRRRRERRWRRRWRRTWVRRRRERRAVQLPKLVAVALVREQVRQPFEARGQDLTEPAVHCAGPREKGRVRHACALYALVERCTAAPVPLSAFEVCPFVRGDIANLVPVLDEVAAHVRLRFAALVVVPAPVGMDLAALLAWPVVVRLPHGPRHVARMAAEGRPLRDPRLPADPRPLAVLRGERAEPRVAAAVGAQQLREVRVLRRRAHRGQVRGELGRVGPARAPRGAPVAAVPRARVAEAPARSPPVRRGGRARVARGTPTRCHRGPRRRSGRGERARRGRRLSGRRGRRASRRRPRCWEGRRRRVCRSR